MKALSSPSLTTLAAVTLLWALASCSGDSSSTAASDVSGLDVAAMDVASVDAATSDSHVIMDEGTPAPDSSTEDVGSDVPPDITEPQWTFGPIDGDETLWVETLSEAPATWVTALGEGRALVVSEGKLWDYNPTENSEITTAEDFDTSALLGAVRTGDGATLIHSDTAIYVVQDGALILSPLTEGLGGATLRTMTRVQPNGEDALWFGSSAGLHRWSSGILNDLDMGDLPAENPLLTYAAADQEHLWVASGSHIYAIDRDADGYQAWSWREDLEALDIAAESSGGLWVRSASGLHRLHEEGGWDDAETEFTPEGIWAAPEAPSLWIRSDSGDLYRWTSTGLKLSLGAAANGHYSPEPEGSLLIANDAGVTRAVPGRSISFTGMSSGEVLSTSREVGLELAFADQVDTLSASIDDEAVSIETDPRRVLINVDELDDGDHVLAVTATYLDGFPESQAELAFTIEKPNATWAEDIEEMSEVHCGQCHGQAGFVEFKLFTKDHWVDNIDQVVNALETNLMPPGAPLDPDIIEIIKLWRDLDFPD